MQLLAQIEVEALEALVVGLGGLEEVEQGEREADIPPFGLYEVAHEHRLGCKGLQVLAHELRCKFAAFGIALLENAAAEFAQEFVLLAALHLSRCQAGSLDREGEFVAWRHNKERFGEIGVEQVGDGGFGNLAFVGKLSVLDMNGVNPRYAARLIIYI